MHILVVGSRQVDAGKTTFTRGLRAATEVPAFKPRAANDRWYHHDVYRAILDDGHLAGRDARLLAEEQGPAVCPEAINPIHRLWGQTPDPTGGMHGVAHRRFLVDRVEGAFVVNANADIPAELQSALPLEGATTVTSLEELNAVVSQRHLLALERWAAAMSDSDASIVESYGDIALPVEGLAFDAVAAVEPRRVRFFDGARYLRTCRAVPQSAREGRQEPIVEEVIGRLDPLGETTLPALTGTMRADPHDIADAYGAAYDALLEVI